MVQIEPLHFAGDVVRALHVADAAELAALHGIVGKDVQSRHQVFGRDRRSRGTWCMLFRIAVLIELALAAGGGGCRHSQGRGAEKRLQHEGGSIRGEEEVMWGIRRRDSSCCGLAGWWVGGLVGWWVRRAAQSPAD